MPCCLLKTCKYESTKKQKERSVTLLFYHLQSCGVHACNMLSELKNIFYKGYDYSEGYVNPLEFHPTVYFVANSYGLLDESVPGWSRFLLLFMMCCAIPALLIAILATIHGFVILDAAVIIETGTYMIIMTYKLIILSCTKLNVPEFHMLLRTLREDFKYACSKGNKYRDRFFENQLQTRKICISVALTMTIIGVGMVFLATLALIYYILSHDPEYEGQRPLLFPFWMFHLDFSKSPTYEIAFIYADICVIAYAYNYIFMIITQLLWVREIAIKADIVIWNIQDLMEGVYLSTNKQKPQSGSNIIKFRMRATIRQHQSMYELMENYCRVYKKLLLFEQIFCGPVACLTAYSAAEKLDEGEVNYILILLCVSSIIVAFVPSYLCSFLMIKVRSVVDACFDTPFWNAGPVIRPYLVLLIQRSLRPLPLRFGGFQEVSLQTFANKMTSAYSCFNMLRQAIK